MSDYLRCKLQLEQCLAKLNAAIQPLDQHRLLNDVSVTRWRQHLEHAHDSLQEQLLRIAVVGSVKSGKSTFINALAGRDLLKRGAGIVTAFITRIQTDQRISGWVALKSWPQIAAEIRDAILPLQGLSAISTESQSLDVRCSEDRQRLAEALHTWWNGLQQDNLQLDPNLVLLRAYLNGYPLLHQQVGETLTHLHFDEHSIQQHQRYVGQEAQAVYLEDMELHFPVPWLGDHLEIADCQGSDSPNPLHFALLQDYLQRSHFILYVISGRTGLREADFKLLDFIKTLRMLPQTLFVLNADLDLHPDGPDLEHMIQRAHGELSWFAPQPQLFTFSALCQLLLQLGTSASRREQLHLGLWRETPELVEQSEAGFRAFRQRLAERVAQQREQVLLGTAVTRLTLVANSLADSVAARKRFLGENLDGAQQAARELKVKQQGFHGAFATLQNAISGSKDTLRNELAAAVDRAFDLTCGPIVVETMTMVDNYPMDRHRLAQLSNPHQLLQQIHTFYLEFRQSLARHLVERVNVRAIEFAKQQEDFLHQHLIRSASLFWSLFVTAMEDYRREAAKLQISFHPCPALQETDWMLWDKTGPPQFSAFVQQSALSRAMLLTKFGLGRLSRFLTSLKSRLGRPLPYQAGCDQNPSLLEAAELVKAESKTELLQAFCDYRHEFKHGYLFRLLEETTERLLQEFQARAEMAQVDFAALLNQGEQQEEMHSALLSVLTGTELSGTAVLDELSAVRCVLNDALQGTGPNQDPGRITAPQPQAD
jgi:hypothetical protein